MSANEYNISTAEFELEINNYNLRNFRLDVLEQILGTYLRKNWVVK